MENRLRSWPKPPPRPRFRPFPRTCSNWMQATIRYPSTPPRTRTSPVATQRSPWTEPRCSSSSTGLPTTIYRVPPSARPSTCNSPARRCIWQPAATPCNSRRASLRDLPPRPAWQSTRCRFSPRPSPRSRRPTPNSPACRDCLTRSTSQTWSDRPTHRCPCRTTTPPPARCIWTRRPLTPRPLCRPWSSSTPM